jgi:nitroreductase
MSQLNPAALEFLHSRRSRPHKTLSTPVPDHDQLEPMLRAGVRVPDHGKLEPWRYIVLERPALERLAAMIPARGQEMLYDDETTTKMQNQIGNAHLVVTVVASPKPSAKIPEEEQLMSAGAVCLSLLNAALAGGWGANWLTGWASRDRTFLRDALGLADHETVAGFIHIGTETSVPPDRDRPDLDAITTWMHG